MSEKHPTTVEGYTGSLEQLAAEVLRLRYDSVAEFLDHLAKGASAEADADRERGRLKLAKELGWLCGELSNASAAARRAWKICKPHMPE